ncbi:MAG: TadE family type IV pilus minor pilin [Mobilicoccus sp.]|nr:TadE family type IV pilus minor pilin [Mobilicoccus sp.]
MVTAEFAISLPAIVLVLALLVGGVGLALDEVRCLDAARTTARALARGDDEGAARERGLRAAPTGADVSWTRSGRDIAVVVTAPRRSVPGVSWPAARAEAFAVQEGG